MLANVQVVAQLWLTSFFTSLDLRVISVDFLRTPKTHWSKTNVDISMLHFLPKPGNSRPPARLQYQDLPANPRKNLFLPLQKQQNRKFTFHKNGIKYFTTFYKTTA